MSLMSNLEIHVLAKGHAVVVSSSNRIGGGNDGAPGLEAGHNTGLEELGLCCYVGLCKAAH